VAFTHGSSAYSNGTCRCDICREATRVAHQKAVARRAARLAADPTLRPHGTINTYKNWGCRCEPCTEAQRLNSAKNYHRRGHQQRNPITQPFGREWLS
jgi:hypothetical protein